ncbi:MAG: type I-E CRISPR-associated protein Cas5/CasD [Proteobacteria bacterium]|nr:type I-E CRISPR-associated protein Cas5/CasD [Pseudomonadota bacterium]
MQHTLLIRLAGPMQAWGSQSRFSIRDTGLFPTKSGVIGLVCAALGRDRAQPVDDLAALRFGVRVDAPGVVMKDFHTVQDAIKASGKKAIGETVISTRYYLADADFLAALEGPDPDFLRALDRALNSPCWPLFLGRKSFPPSLPVRVPGGLLESVNLEDALTCHPWPRPLCERRRNRPEDLLAVLETPFGEGAVVVRDQPVGAAFEARSFLGRHMAFRKLPVREEA